MPVYNFKKINPIPNAPDMIDIILTRTQRKTPTVIHPGYKITRIRSFYMRKIKFTQQTIHERLSQILTDFPRLDDIHPFYSDLCNTLYDRDHYKLALGQINTARSVIDAISRDMVRMVKYADSLYRCKCLKRAALGRMMTVLKGQKSSLLYLEEVRKHLSRLPALDPNARTILLTGFPNVGKSSFMNKITRANVDVQPYAFTTKSLFVGHCDYRYLRWQVIDTPGILDHPLEERNTIEMQAITALAHLTCSVLYFMDVSEQCGYTLEQQCKLLESIRPLFVNKEVVLVANKVDVLPFDELEQSKQDMIKGIAKDLKCEFMTMSNVSELGVSEVKQKACDKLLASRVDARLSSHKTNKVMDNVMNRLQVFHPTPRDEMNRKPTIPDTVRISREQKNAAKRSSIGYAVTKHNIKVDDDDDEHMTETNATKTARELMWENGGPGVWAPDYRHQYDLKDEEWRYDAIPQIINGKNIADYIDPDIEAKLAALEQEEQQIVSELQNTMQDDDSDLDEEEEVKFQAIKDKQQLARVKSRMNRNSNHPKMPRSIRGKSRDKHDPGVLTADAIKKKMEDVGVDASLMIENRAKPKRTQYSMSRSLKLLGNGTDGDEGRSLSKRRKLLVKTPNQLGLKDEHQRKLATKEERLGQKQWEGMAGEGDRRTLVHLVQWMNTGKKRNGTHNKR